MADSKSPWALAIAVAALIGAAAPACGDPAVESLVTDRPDFTESAVCVPRGRWQLEAGATTSRAGAIREQALGEMLLRAGAAARVEVRLGMNSHVWTRGPRDGTSGLEDPSLGVKLALAKGADGFAPLRPAAALIVATSLPLGAQAYRASTAEPEAKLCLAWTLFERVGLAANGNVARRSGDTPRAEGAASVSLATSWTDRLGSYVEGFGFRTLDEDRHDATAYLDGGLTWLVHPDLQLDARAGVGRNGVDPEWFGGLGVSRRW